ncbi:MAG: DUF3037 domain-containing protein [Muribaculaceae bacterium]|nr:DUF3037 domain-containing protein [Muribaculaceae bacterium]
MMAEDKEKLIYEFCVLRYVPDVEREEFVNVGLLMMCKRMRWMRAEVVCDAERLSVFGNKANCRRLSTQLGVFTRKDVPAPDLPVEERYRWMAAMKSAIIQTSQSHPGILFTTLSDARRELDLKFDELLCRLVK